MNNKGFTLVELLAVIVVLAIIVSIAVPSTISVSRKVKANLYCEKINSIVNAASLYGEDHKESFGETFNLESKNCYDEKADQYYNVEGGSVIGKKITVGFLIDEGYLKKDKSEDGRAIDPRTNEDMENKELLVYLKYGRIYVHFDDEDANNCVSECKQKS